MAFSVGINSRDLVAIEVSKTLTVEETRLFMRRLNHICTVLETTTAPAPEVYTVEKWTPTTATKTAPEPVTVQNEPAPTLKPEHVGMTGMEVAQSIREVDRHAFDVAKAVQGGKIAKTIRLLHERGWDIPRLARGSNWSATLVARTLVTQAHAPGMKRAPRKAKAVEVVTPAPEPAPAPEPVKEAAQSNLPFVPAPPQHRPIPVIEAELRGLMERKRFNIPKTPEDFERDARRLAVKGYNDIQSLSQELVAAIDSLRRLTPSSPSAPLGVELREKRDALVAVHGNRRRAVIHQVQVEKMTKPDIMRFWGIGSSTLAEYLGERSTGLSYVSQSQGTTAGNGTVDASKLFGGIAREARK